MFATSTGRARCARSRFAQALHSVLAEVRLASKAWIIVSTRLSPTTSSGTCDGSSGVPTCRCSFGWTDSSNCELLAPGIAMNDLALASAVQQNGALDALGWDYYRFSLQAANVTTGTAVYIQLQSPADVESDPFLTMRHGTLPTLEIASLADDVSWSSGLKAAGLLLDSSQSVSGDWCGPSPLRVPLPPLQSSPHPAPLRAMDPPDSPCHPGTLVSTTTYLREHG